MSAIVNKLFSIVSLFSSPFVSAYTPKQKELLIDADKGKKISRSSVIHKIIKVGKEEKEIIKANFTKSEASKLSGNIQLLGYFETTEKYFVHKKETTKVYFCFSYSVKLRENNLSIYSYPSYLNTTDKGSLDIRCLELKDKILDSNNHIKLMESLKK